MKQLDTNKYLLCNGLDCSCPVVTIDEVNNEVKIVDDYNQEIKMTISQFLEFENAINAFKNSK